MVENDVFLVLEVRAGARAVGKINVEMRICSVRI
jgi:hypothetical protein